MRILRLTVILLAALSLVFTMPTSVRAKDLCTEFDLIARKGSPISSEMTRDYQAVIDCTISALPSFTAWLEETREREIRDEFFYGFVGLTGATIQVIERDGREAIEHFRARDNTQVARALAAGARHGSRRVRLNAANLFSNVIDNTTLCVALDYLHAPVRERTQDNADIIGRANLIYLANVVTLWAYEENAKALEAVAVGLRQHITSPEMGLFASNLKDTMRGLESIEQNLSRARSGEGLRVPSTGIPFALTSAEDALLKSCRTYEFQFWKTQNDGRYFNGETVFFELTNDNTTTNPRSEVPEEPVQPVPSEEN